MSRSADGTGCRVDMRVVMTANRQINWRRDLFLEIDTFAPASEIGAGVAEVLQLLRLAVIEPALGQLPVGRPRFSWSPTNGSSTRRYKVSDSNWELLREAAAGGGLGHFVFDDGATGLDPVDSGFLVAELVLRQRSEFTIGWAHSFEVRCSRRLADDLSVDLQRRWIQLGKAACVELCASTGFITYDNMRGGSPFERFMQIRDGLRTADRFARGYFWGTFLGPMQVAALRGVDAIMRAAPCERVELLGEERVYLQITSDIRDVTREQMRALREFLQPVLRNGEPDPYEQEHWFMLAEE